MSNGWELRLGILRQDAENKLLAPLRAHGWTATIEREVEQGEYLVVKAERAGIEHHVAIMYTSATANAVYKALAPQVEHIFIKGELYKLESYAYGVTTPVSTADDFHAVLIGWNNACATGKFAPIAPAAPIVAQPPKHRLLLSEEPIEAIWLRLRQLTSVSLAQKLVKTRAAAEGVPLDDKVVRSKAEGLAYSLRNASDYFKTRDGQNVSQRVLNLYYGSMAFAFAEVLAAPKGLASLAAIEKITTQGHGLCTLDGEQDGLEHVVVSTVATGFFASWMNFLGIPTDAFPSKKPKTYADLTKQPESSWLTVETLFARIPEVADVFLDIFSSKPAWVTPTYDQEANPPFSFSGKQKDRPTTTYSIFVDDSARLTTKDIAALPGPIGQISELVSKHPGRHFRVAVDAAGKESWWDALPVHHSPFERAALIVPAFGVVGEYRAICTALLYALSIMVRYRPSVWRRVQDGDHDHLRVLVEAFLAVVERVLPEQFLERISAQRVFAKQPGAWLSSRLTRITKLRHRVFRDFTWPNELHTFAKFNVIYGWNGCGKTTLSSLLSLVEKKTALTEGEVELELDGATRVAGSAFASAQLPQVRVFNRDFIGATLSQVGRIEPIYFLGEDSVEKQAQVEQLKKDLAFANSEVMAAQTVKTNAESKLDDFCRDKAKVIKELLTTGNSAAYNNYNKARFKSAAEALSAASAAAAILTGEQKTPLRSQKDAQPKPTIEKVTPPFIDIAALTSDVEALADRAVVAQTLGELKTNAQLAAWVQTGLSLHSGEHASDTCRFCQQPFDAKRRTALEAHFNDAFASFQKDLAALLAKLKIAKQSVAAFSLPDISRFYEALTSELSTASAKVSTARFETMASIDALIARVEAKRDNPFAPAAAAAPTVPTPSSLADSVAALNAIVEGTTRPPRSSKRRSTKPARSWRPRTLPRRTLSSFFSRRRWRLRSSCSRASGPSPQRFNFRSTSWSARSSSTAAPLMS